MRAAAPPARMLRLSAPANQSKTAAAAATTSAVLIACRRCLLQSRSLIRPASAAASSLQRPRHWVASSARPVGGSLIHCGMKAPPLSIALLSGSRRSYSTLDTLRTWFIDGPEAAVSATGEAASTSAAAAPLDSGAAAEAAASSASSEPPSSFFVEDAPSALQELIESSSMDPLATVTSSLVEPSFASLGLGTGLWPSSLQLKVLETLHVTLDMPWWLCAILMGISVRLILLVPNMLMQRTMRLDVPRYIGMTKLMERSQLFSRSGNTQESMRVQMEVMEKFPEFVLPGNLKKLQKRFAFTMGSSLFGMLFVQLASIRAIYKATALPVESFQQGGILWLTDLTCIDPYFVLPAAITSLLMLNVHQYYSTLPQGNKQTMAAVRPLAYTMLPACAFTFLIPLPGANLFYFFATGCVAQLVHLANRTDRAKDFWKARIGLPRLEELPPMANAQSDAALERIRNQVTAAVNNQSYQATRLADQSDQAPKTYRIRRLGQQQQQQQKSRSII